MTVRLRLLCWAALLAAGGAVAQETARTELTGSVSLQHRRLVERTATGGTLLTESGPMGQLQLLALRTLSGGGAVAGRFSIAGGDLDYDGQTQAGAPLTTTTRQGEFAADLLWRPHEPAAWGEAWLTVGALVNRRAIYGTQTAGGLDELSAALMLGALWRSPSWAFSGAWRARMEAEGRISAAHRLHVDYHGLLDSSHLEGARKRQLALRVALSAQNSPWEWTLEWSRLGQRASSSVPVYRGGVLFGTVHQPELSIRDVGVRLSRRF